MLEEDPDKRMTCEDALNHPWLFPLRESYEDSLLWNSSESQDSVNNSGDYVAHDYAIYDPNPAEASYRKISLRKLSLVPGAFCDGPRTPAPTYAQPAPGSQLYRRADEINERDPEGRLRSWELLPPDENEDAIYDRQPDPREHPANDALCLDSPLTSLSEGDEGDGEPSVVDTPQAGPSHATREGGSARKRTTPGRGRGKIARVAVEIIDAPSRRTRAAVAREAHEPMDVETVAQSSRAPRHSERRTSPHKRAAR